MIWVTIMRGFLFIVMIAFLLNGYGAVAHAFSASDCNPQIELADDNTDADSTAPCLDCHHCCVSHAIPQSTHNVIAMTQSAPLNPPRLVTYTGDYHFSLLRPPKSLV